MTINEIANMILEETDEVVNHYYFSELLSDIPEKYRNLKSSVFSSILHCINEIYKEFDPKGIPSDEVYAAIGEKIWNKSEFESTEFVRGIITAYEERVKNYKEIHKDEDSENAKIRNAINWLSKDELRIALAKSQGLNIVCEDWPCEYGIDSTGIDSAIDVKKDENGNWVPVSGLEKDREFDLRYPVSESYSGGWPPKKSTLKFAEEGWMESRVDPIPNYSDDILVAMSLVSDLKQQGFDFEIRRSVIDNAYKCTFSRDNPYKISETGISDTLPQAICKAHLMATLLHLNPTIKDSVINFEKDGEEEN